MNEKFEEFIKQNKEEIAKAHEAKTFPSEELIKKAIDSCVTFGPNEYYEIHVPIHMDNVSIEYQQVWLLTRSSNGFIDVRGIIDIKGGAITDFSLTQRQQEHAEQIADVLEELIKTIIKGD